MKSILRIPYSTLPTLIFIALCAAVFLALAFIQNRQAFGASSILTNPNLKRSTSTNVFTLPVQPEENGKIIDDMNFRLPQEGDFAGKFTQQVIAYEKNHTFSILYPIQTVATNDKNEPYLGNFSPPRMLFKSDLPQPTVTGAILLDAIDLSEKDATISFSPAVTARVPLEEPQHTNTKITAYFYDTTTRQYVVVAGSLSSDGSAYVFPVTKTGYYIVYDSPGALPLVATPTPSPTPTPTAQDKVVDATPTPTPAPQSPTPSPTSTATISIEPQAVSLFTDVAGHWAQQYVDILAQAGLTDGTTTFSPDTPATRAELAELLAKIVFSPEEIESCIETNIPSPFIPVFFTDVPQSSSYAKYICTIAIGHLTTGLQDGTFAPEATLTRAEALKFLYTAAGADESAEAGLLPFEDVLPSDWFYPAIARGVADGIVDGFTIQTSDGGLQIVAERVNNNERSENAATVQKILKDIGFYTGEITGAVSDEVVQAITQYQLARGIIKTPQDATSGNIGPATITQLNSEKAGTNVQTRRLFRPHDTVTRAELAKFAVLILGIGQEATTK